MDDDFLGSLNPSRGRGNDQWRERGNDQWRERGNDQWRERGNDQWRERGNDQWRERGNDQWHERDNYPSRGRGNYPSRGRGNYPSRGRGNYPSRGRGNYHPRGRGGHGFEYGGENNSQNENWNTESSQLFLSRPVSTPFSNNEEISQYINWMHDTRFKDKVLNQLTSSDGLDRLEEILEVNSSSQFKSIGANFCKFLVDEDTKNSNLKAKWKRILEAVFLDFGYLRDSINCLNKLHLSTDPDLLTIMCPFLDLVLQMLKCIPDAAQDSGFVRNSKALLELANQIENSPKNASLNETMKRFRQLKQRIARQLKLQTETTDSDNTGPADFFIVKKKPAVGDWGTIGPWHDNDKEDFREIKVFPTEEEIRSPHQVYLPREKKNESELDKETRISRHLDRIFRWYREDNLGMCRDLIRTFFAIKNARRVFSYGQTTHIETGLGNKTAVLGYSYAKVDRLEIVRNHGLVFKVIFDSPKESHKLSKKARNEFLHETARVYFPQGAFFFLVARIPVSPNDDAAANVCSGDIVPCQITSAPEEADSAKRWSITLRPICPSYRDDMLDLFDQDDTKHEKTWNILLPVRDILYDVQIPVLKWLQNESICDFPIMSHIFGDPESQSDNDKKYSTKSLINLNFLWKGAEIERPKQFSMVDIEEPEEIRTLLNSNLSNIWLDETQIDAYIHGISAPLALIQGPPGCGKSHVGQLIARTFLENKSVFSPEHPILVVCYTNHALDQTIGNLLNSKAVSEYDLIRVGGNSTSEQIQECSLANARERSGIRAYRHGDLVKKFESDKMDCSKAVESWRQSYRSFSKNRENDKNELKGFKNWLKEFHRKEHDEICGDEVSHRRNDTHSVIYFQRNTEKEDDFETVGGFRALLKIWAEKTEDRSTRLKQLQDEYLNSLKSYIIKLASEADQSQKKISQVLQSRDGEVLRDAKIIGATTSGCAKYSEIIQSVAPRIVIIEEAAEINQAHSFAALSRNTEKFILIGDHLQLRPKVAKYHLSVEAGKGFSLDESLFEYLIREIKIKPTTLGTQRRMCPEISKLLSETIYPYLKDDQSVNDRPPLKGFRHRLWFFDHDYPEDTFSNTGKSLSKQNYMEARMAVELAGYAAKRGIRHEKIAILTPYLGQLRLIKTYLERQNIRVELDDRDKKDLDLQNTVAFETEDDAKLKKSDLKLRNIVKVRTVDNFQGEEAEVVIISTVRNNVEGKLGFLNSPHRTNVMFSRAKNLMIVLGSSSLIERQKESCLLKKFYNIMKKLGVIGRSIPLICQNHATEFDVSRYNEFPLDGGCEIACTARRSCGHACTRLCHADDPDHSRERCTELCSLMLPCNHPCPKQCREDCGPCNVVIGDYTFSECKHTVPIKCHQKDDPNFKCFKRCEAKLTCGHQCSENCGACTAAGKHSSTCNEKCKRVLGCGHVCDQSPCHSKESCPPCETTCSVSCEHSSCGKKCKLVCSLCADDCNWRCTNDHPDKKVCSLACGSVCNRLPCDERCTKKLKCGHRCPSLCGEFCPSDSYCVDCAAENKKDTENTRDQIVDIILQTPLKDIDLSYPGNLILVLKCGHAFTVETLDCHLEMRKFYRGTDDAAPWTDTVSLSHVEYDRQLDFCIQCRLPIAGVRRYGRVLNFKTQKFVQGKWIGSIKSELKSVNEELTSFGEFCDKLESATYDKWLDSKPRIRDLYAQINKLHDQVITHDPTKGVYEKESSFYGSSGRRKEAHDYCLRLSKDPEVKVKRALLLITWQFILYYFQRFSAEVREFRRINFQISSAEHELMHEKFSNVLEGILQKFSKAVKLSDNFQKICTENFYERTLKATAENIVLKIYAINGIIRSKELNLRTFSTEKLHDFQQLLLEEMERIAKISDSSEANTLVEAVKESSKSDAEMAMIAKAMKAAEKYGYDCAYGGPFYNCPNGHPYFIGDCGGAMEESNCPECGEKIGGQEHHLVNTNSKNDELTALGNQ